MIQTFLGYSCLAPPNVFIVLCLVGALLASLRRRLGQPTVLVAGACLFVAATPAFSSYLISLLGRQIPEESERLRSAQAIVVLGADVHSGYQGAPDRLGEQSLERLVFAADAHRQLHLPVAVSGGRLSDWRTPVAELIKRL
jgi:uncharacterized SAM-binding protein YcdF (DUF218 family)